MINKFGKMCLLLCAAQIAPMILVPSVANASDHKHDADDAFIRNAEQKIDTAYNTMDLNGALAYETPDNVSIDIKGNKEDLAGQKKELAQMFALAKSISCTTTVTSITYKKNTAEVLDSSTIVVTIPTKDPGPNTLTDQVTTKEIWVKQSDGTWLQQSSLDLTDNPTESTTPTPQTPTPAP